MRSCNVLERKYHFAKSTKHVYVRRKGLNQTWTQSRLATRYRHSSCTTNLSSSIARFMCHVQCNGSTAAAAAPKCKIMDMNHDCKYIATTFDLPGLRKVVDASQSIQHAIQRRSWSSSFSLEGVEGNHVILAAAADVMSSSRCADPNASAKLSHSRETSHRLKASELTYAWIFLHLS
jgi:hypothetical protein